MRPGVAFVADNPSIHEIWSVLDSERLVRPAISGTARSMLGRAVNVLEGVGLPTVFADWFRPTQHIIPYPEATGRVYKVGSKDLVINNAVLLGQNDFGRYVVDCDTACIVYLDSSGSNQLINTSVERFLYFVGRFWKSTDAGFTDIAALLADCKAVDPPALADAEGVWSVMIEEAGAGLY
jgi:SUKH-4 immunity protein